VREASITLKKIAPIFVSCGYENCLEAWKRISGYIQSELRISMESKDRSGRK